MDRNSIDQAAAQAGIMADYVNAHGQQQAITPESKRALLAAMNSKAASADAAPLPPVKVFFQRQPIVLPLAGSGEYGWELIREDGGRLQGRAGAGKTFTLPAGELPLGYHQLRLTQQQQSWQCRLIIAPDAVMSRTRC
ncbi:4-alpha-glucanotransferase [Serratia rubidaea]|uniref:4-alpha-glucanotransferase n=1 Tax=Serratia rubidaea TaxID=61652 RepID=A0A447QKU5_SERRU|nr:4-alpha-glucanotransferase [Serratia rubidaea]